MKANKDKTLDRLSRLEGQVRGVAKMVESDRYCMDILAQTAAIRSESIVASAIARTTSTPRQKGPHQPGAGFAMTDPTSTSKNPCASSAAASIHDDVRAPMIASAAKPAARPSQQGNPKHHATSNQPIMPEA